MAQVVAIVVLYQQTPHESVALRMLLEGIRGREHSLHVQIYDNSPASQAHLLQSDITGDIHVGYFHNKDNGGLAAAYNYALHWAAEECIPWLMLLDQDTEVPAGYVEEALRLCSKPNERVCAMTPRLIVHGEQRSPHLDGVSNVAGSLSGGRPISSGLSEQRLGAWNSGAILRVARLVAMGGFPEEFPLDNLDYAVFHMLQQGRERIFVMNSRLNHQLSVADLQSLSEGRLRSKLAADVLLQRRLGHRTRLNLAVELLRTGLSLLYKLPDKRMGLTCLRFSIGALFSAR